MKKNYNVPATDVVALVNESMIMAGSPTNIVPPGSNIPDGSGTEG